MSTEPNEPTSEAAFFSAIRSWGVVRADERVFGGVLSGVGRKVGMAPAPARIIFALATLLIGGPLIVLYAAAWALFPDTEGRIIIQDFGRGRPQVGQLVAIGIMTLIGIGMFGNPGWNHWWNLGLWDLRFGDAPGPSWLFGMFLFLIPAAVVAGIVVLIVWLVRSSKAQDRTTHGYARLPDGSLPTVPDAVATESARPAEASGIIAESLPSEPSAAEPAPPIYAAVPAPPVYSGPPVYTAPPRPRVPGPGKLGYLLALAWIPMSVAITLYLVTTDQLAVFPVVAGGVIYVAGLGLILIITALRGRKLGFLGFISVLALIPVGVAIGTAPELREHYAAGDWRVWWRDAAYSESYPEPSTSYVETPAFDPSSAFLDYETVAISGSCWEEPDLETQESEGTVRLSSIPADQTITVTSNSTRLVIPEGTSLRVLVVDHSTSNEMGWTTQADIRWPDRDVACSTSYGATDAVALLNSDKPVLTVRLDDAQQAGNMSLWIEEN